MISVVFVFSNLTFPPFEGLHIQSTSLIRELRKRGVRVGVISMVRNIDTIDSTAMINWVEGLEFVDVIPTKMNYPLLLVRNMLLSWFPSVLLHTVKKRLLDWPDAIIHIEGIGLAPLLLSCANHGSVMSTVDAWSLRQVRLAGRSTGFKRFFLRFYAALSAATERKYFPLAGAVHVVSLEDASYLFQKVPLARFETIPVALIDIPCILSIPKHDIAINPTVVFWGDIGVPHLRDGLEWLFSKVVPRLIDFDVQINWVVLGRREPDKSLRELASGAQFISWVDDVNTVLKDATVVLLPDKSGTGLKNRTLHAMASGVPVLGSSFAFEGIPITDGVDALISDTDEAFATALMQLLQSSTFCDSLGKSGRAFVLKGYRMDAIVDKWLNLYQSLAQIQSATKP